MISTRNNFATSPARSKTTLLTVRKCAATILHKYVTFYPQSSRITGLLTLLGFTDVLTGIYLRSSLPLRTVIVFSLVLAGLILGLLLLIDVSARITITAAYSLPARFAVLGTQALVTFIPFIALGQIWFSPRLSEAAWLLCVALGAALVLSGRLQLIAAIAQLRARRDEQVNSVIIRERMRFSRDLHDLLGYSLSAIALKAELAERTVTDNPSVARDEIIDVLSAARQALTEVRTAAHGYRNICLAKEASATASLLEDAGIQTHIELAYGALTEDADSVLAVVLREAVTNVLRHSAARNCSITVKQVDGDRIRLRVTNDGMSCTARRNIRGDGLDNMASRLKEIGGELVARSTGGPESAPGQFQVTVNIPRAIEVTD